MQLVTHNSLKLIVAFTSLVQLGPVKSYYEHHVKFALFPQQVRQGLEVAAEVMKTERTRHTVPGFDRLRRPVPRGRRSLPRTEDVQTLSKWFSRLMVNHNSPRSVHSLPTVMKKTTVGTSKSAFPGIRVGGS